jgi:hypothetical protein
MLIRYIDSAVPRQKWIRCPEELRENGKILKKQEHVCPDRTNGFAMAKWKGGAMIGRPVN